jgi:hypothetical protein
MDMKDISKCYFSGSIIMRGMYIDNYLKNDVLDMMIYRVDYSILEYILQEKADEYFGGV